MQSLMNDIDTIFFDMDGTLVDCRQRLYSLFVELTGTCLSYEEYWDYKRKGYNQKNMLGLVNHQEAFDGEFGQKWLVNVERDDLLRMDTLHDGARKTLESLYKAGIKLYVVTNRQRIGALKKQLAYLKIDEYFVKVISTLQRCSKAEAVKHCDDISISKAVFIGDSEEDIQAAKDLGILGVLVSKELHKSDAGFLKTICGIDEVMNIIQ